MADEKTLAPASKEDALKYFIDSYRWLVTQQGQGVHTPLPRQLKQIIKLHFRKDGVDAISAVERDLLNAKGVTPALNKRPSVEQPKKGSADRRLERISMREIGQEDGANTKARINRMQRLAQRGLLETPMSRTVSEEKENVAAGDDVKVQRVKKEAVKVEMEAQPLNTTEIQLIATMGAKEIVDSYGADRILATLTAFNDPDLSLAGSPKQLANRLKFRIYPQDGK